MPADGERRFISYVLAFFAASDGIVLENLSVHFMQGGLVCGGAQMGMLLRQEMRLSLRACMASGVFFFFFFPFGVTCGSGVR